MSTFIIGNLQIYKKKLLIIINSIAIRNKPMPTSNSQFTNSDKFDNLDLDTSELQSCENRYG